MKTNMSAVCLIAMLTLSACNSNSSPTVTSDSVRLSGNERCLDMEKLMSRYEALPGDQGIYNQVTDITVIAGPSSDEFEASAIRAFYESDTVPHSKDYDGSKTTQIGCDSVKITYRNGRSDDYKITEFTEDSLKLVLQGGDDETVHLHRLNDQAYEIQYNTYLGLCGSSNDQVSTDNSGSVEISKTVSWATPLPVITLAPDFEAKVQKALSTPEPSCPDLSNNS